MVIATHSMIPLIEKPLAGGFDMQKEPPEDRTPSPDTLVGSPLKRRQDVQMISTAGVSGHARVMNFGGDNINIAHIHDGSGKSTSTALATIKDRLMILIEIFLDVKIYDWLASPDVHSNYNAARRKHHPGTGSWFLTGDLYSTWRRNADDILDAARRFSGRCSSIIEDVKDLCKSQRLSGYAYFFFDRRDASHGLLLFENLLRSILSQLASRCGGAPAVLKESYEDHGAGREQPSLKALYDTLRLVVEGFDHVYIVIDSLDECGDRAELLQSIKTIANWDCNNVHLLLTSRPEPDITGPLGHIDRICPVRIQGAALYKDIAAYLDAQLSSKHRWGETRKLVKNTLIAGSDGMFRWVALQMDGLQKCLNARDAKAQLKGLPKSLEETYEQTLIKSPYPRDLLQMLHWLAFSARALRLEEIAEVLSVDFDAENGPRHDPDMRYESPQIALAVCSGLITEVEGTVKLAHFSVKEYLMSDRIKMGQAKSFAICARTSHSLLAQSCLVYLHIFNTQDSIQCLESMTERFPLHTYAAKYVTLHLKSVENDANPHLHQLVLDLFASHRSSALLNWIRMSDPDLPWAGVPVKKSLRKTVDQMAQPLYYASLFGLDNIVRHLLRDGANPNRTGGRYGTAIQVAAYGGHEEVVRLLLEAGADVNIQAGFFGTALQAASWEGHGKIIMLLLQGGTNVDIQGGYYSTALQAAARNGRTGIVKLLLDEGANANLQGGEYYDTALDAAAGNGHMETVQVLLDSGAKINLLGGNYYSTALQAAAGNGHPETFRLLLLRGADASLQGGLFGTALQAASWGGHHRIVKHLLESGVDVNSQGGKFGNALAGAAFEGQKQTVALLLDHGADVNLPAGVYGTALQAASYGDNKDIVELLLEKHADVNCQGGEYGTALQAAAASRRLETVKLLLESGADVNAQAGLYCTALQAASHKAHEGIVKLLLERGAETNIRGGKYGTALRAAKSDVTIQRILLDNGAMKGEPISLSPAKSPSIWRAWNDGIRLESKAGEGARGVRRQHERNLSVDA
ncbi:hypothetical protein HWV62_31859 [Athelia sp. TMB]|nr:hypothetical protein HWV62_31859 [Athelia sp. TMB]